MAKDIYNPLKPFNEDIRELIKSTHPSKGPIIVSPFGKRFKIDRDQKYWKNLSELTGSDTIGTKGVLHWEMNTLAEGAQDAFAMVVDDLIEGGFVPVTLQNQILMPEDQTKILILVKRLVELCKANKWQYAKGKFNPIIISGGETCQLNTIQGFEMGITATGYVKEGEAISSNAKEGDAIIGLGSNGIHCNGLSFYRDEFFSKRKKALNTMLPWGTTIGKELTKPTLVYLPAIKALIDSFTDQKGAKANAIIHGMVHITGGGMSKLKELIPNKNTDIMITSDHKLRPQQIFQYAYDEFGVPSEKMYLRFNNGVGYAIAIDPSFSKQALATLRKYFKAEEIGRVKKGAGRILIESQYDSSVIEYR